MKTENFQIFCQVVETGSFSEVARLNYLTQPAITRKINQLEDMYGTLLFNRDGVKLSLTETGEILYPFAKEIINHEIKSLEEIQTYLGVREQTIRIGASLTIGDYVLPNIIGLFNQKHDDMMFELTTGNTPFILELLQQNKIDLALIESDVDHERFITQKFSQDELVLITSNKHKWHDRKEITLIEFVKEKIIWREKNSGMRLMIENALRDYGVFVHVENTMELGSIQAIKSAVEADLGVSLLPQITVEKELKYGTLHHVNIQNFSIQRPLWIVEKPQRFINSKVTKFKQFVREYKKFK